MSNSPKVQQNFNAPVYGVTGKIAKDQTELKFDYIVKFTAWTNLDSNISQERLLTKEILIAITSELAKKSGKFNDTSYCSVLVAPEIFEKFIITETGLNYKSQIVDVPRLLECWESLKFPFYIDTTAFNFYKGWAISDVGTGIPKNL
jgi:hypothetical protein